MSLADARAHVAAGLGVWSWVSTDGGLRPDVVLVGIGNETNQEVRERKHSFDSRGA